MGVGAPPGIIDAAGVPQRVRGRQPAQDQLTVEGRQQPLVSGGLPTDRDGGRVALDAHHPDLEVDELLDVLDAQNTRTTVRNSAMKSAAGAPLPL